MHSALPKNHTDTKNNLFTYILLLLLALSFIFMIRPMKAAAKYLDKDGDTVYEKGDKFIYPYWDALFEVDLTPYKGHPGTAKVIGRNTKVKNPDIRDFTPDPKRARITIYKPHINIDKTYLAQCDNGYVFVTEIAPKAFKNDKYLETVLYNDNKFLITIGASAFENCKKLTHFSCVSGVLTKIDKRAFYNCKKLIHLHFDTTKLSSIKKDSFPTKLPKGKIIYFGCRKEKMKAYAKLLKKSGITTCYVVKLYV